AHAKPVQLRDQPLGRDCYRWPWLHFWRASNVWPHGQATLEAIRQTEVHLMYFCCCCCFTQNTRSFQRVLWKKRKHENREKKGGLLFSMIDAQFVKTTKRYLS